MERIEHEPALRLTPESAPLVAETAPAAISLGFERTIIGRDPHVEADDGSAAAVVDLPWLSRMHCHVSLNERTIDPELGSLRPPSCNVTDLSSCGTYINGVRIRRKGEPHLCFDGDVISLFKSRRAKTKEMAVEFRISLIPGPCARLHI